MCRHSEALYTSVTPNIGAVRMGYGVRDGFASRSDPTLWWASCLDLDQSIGLATCRGATVGTARDLIGARLQPEGSSQIIVRRLSITKGAWL